MTNIRPLIAGVTLAAVALAFVGVGAYSKYKRYHAPIAATPIALPAPATKAPEPAPAKAAPAKMKAKKLTKRERRKVRRAALPDVKAALAADANGSKPITCDEVRRYVNTYPKWLLSKFEAAATEEQKARGRACFG